jgi:hypothetical protein
MEAHVGKRIAADRMGRGRSRILVVALAQTRFGLLARVGTQLAASLIVIAGLLFTLSVLEQHHQLLFDFKGGLYDAGTAILHGRNPYRAGFLAHQAAIFRAGGAALGSTAADAFSIPLYPAPANLAIVPFSAAPFLVAGVLFTLTSLGAMMLGLRLLGVRDWRCFVVTVVAWPTLFALQLGALGPLLMLGTAILWCTRDRLWPPAIALATIVVAKLFPFPLAVWLLVTRRLRAFALTVLIGTTATVVAWATIGFAGMAQYPHMVSDAALIQEPRATSLVAVLLALGIPAAPAKALALAAAGALLLIAWLRARGTDGERRAFALALLAALTASPIVWEHYMVLLFVPIALASPRISALWFVPLSSPLLVLLSTAVVPLSHAAAGSSGQTVRAAVVWLLLEAVVGIWLCVDPASSRALHLRSPLPTGAQTEPIVTPSIQASDA